MEYTFYKLSIAGKCYVGSTTDFENRMKNHTS
jgi:predicted GIY-YIG superfamily endonuclease